MLNLPDNKKDCFCFTLLCLNSQVKSKVSQDAQRYNSNLVQVWLIATGDRSRYRFWGQVMSEWAVITEGWTHSVCYWSRTSRKLLRLEDTFPSQDPAQGQLSPSAQGVGRNDCKIMKCFSHPGASGSGPPTSPHSHYSIGIPLTGWQTKVSNQNVTVVPLHIRSTLYYINIFNHLWQKEKKNFTEIKP